MEVRASFALIVLKTLDPSGRNYLSDGLVCFDWECDSYRLHDANGSKETDRRQGGRDASLVDSMFAQEVPTWSFCGSFLP